MPKSLHSETVRAEVLSRIAVLTPESRPAWGRMNVSQMLCHLSDALRMAESELAVKSKGKLAFQRFPLKHLALYVVPWPKGAPTAPELLSTQPAEFGEDAARLRALVGAFPERKSKPWPAHPLFGPLSETQWGHLCYRHLDHHLTQFGV